MSIAERSPADKSRPARHLVTKAKASAQRVGDLVISGIKFFSPEMRIVIVTGVFTIIATLLSVVAAKPDILQDLFKKSELHAKLVLANVRIKAFKDRAYDARPLYVGKAGLTGSKFVGLQDIFDDTEYTYYYELYPHKVPLFPTEFHTSGRGEAHPVYPPDTARGEDPEAYNKSGGKIVPHQIELKDGDGHFREHVVISSRSINGLQRNADGVNYESDVGLHIRQATDLAEIIVDFSSLDYEALVASEPKVYLVKGDGHRTQLPSTFESGIVKAETKNPPLKSTLWCDWQWSSEKPAPDHPRATGK